MASAQAAVDLGHQSLDAEQKKYALGASTTTLVLQNQSALAQAESTLVSAMAAYEKAQVELDRATGLLLDHAGILIADAERGEVTHMPSDSVCGSAGGRAGLGDAASSRTATAVAALLTQEQVSAPAQRSYAPPVQASLHARGRECPRHTCVRRASAAAIPPPTAFRFILSACISPSF